MQCDPVAEEHRMRSDGGDRSGASPQLTVQRSADGPHPRRGWIPKSSSLTVEKELAHVLDALGLKALPP
jgi:hypothetical protein